MLPELQNLLQLQKADQEIQRLNEEIATLPKRVAAIEEKLAGTKAVLEKARAAVKAEDLARRKHESAIQDLQQKISKYRDQMLEVKTNDQYRALQHEVDFSSQQIRDAEDKILELMLNAEARDKEIKAAAAQLKEASTEVEKEKVEARERAAQDEKELGEWKTVRERLRNQIPPEWLRHYDRVVKLRRSGLSEVRDHKCMACQVMLRPQTYNDVRSGGALIVCDSCQRILYFDPSSQVAAEKAAVPVRRRHHPKLDARQAWFYCSSYAGQGEILLAFNNEKGTSSRRLYDFNTGRQIGDITAREGEYRLAFPEDLSQDCIRLNGDFAVEELDSWGAEMPMVVLDQLHADLQAARQEAAAKSRPEPAERSPSQATAS